MKMYGILPKKLTIRDKVMYHRILRSCPGNKLHDVPPRRQEILFRNYVERPQSSWIVYWNSHPEQYKALLSCRKVSKSLRDSTKE